MMDINYDKLGELIKKSNWKEHTPCSISADLEEKYFMVASMGHSGCGFVKSFSFYYKPHDAQIVMLPAPMSEKMVELAYASAALNKDERIKEIENIINNMS